MKIMFLLASLLSVSCGYDLDLDPDTQATSSVGRTVDAQYTLTSQGVANCPEPESGTLTLTRNS